MRLNYILPEAETVHTSPVTVTVRENETHYASWLNYMIMSNPDTMFFYTVDSTDIWEDVIDFNTIVWRSGDGLIHHTYDPLCPHDCTGQMEGCIYRKKEE